MDGKIALEEHWEPVDFDVTGEHVLTAPDYFAEVERRLKEVDERVKDMDRNGIGVSILSLTQPRVSCLPLLDCRCSARHCRHPPIHAEYTSMLRGVHAICGSAPEPTTAG